MFATDRDLLVLEPGLFGEVAWFGQRLVSGQGGVAGAALAMTSQDVGFDSAGVGAGNVVLVARTPYEVVSRVSGSVLEISRLRESAGGATIPPASVGTAKVEVFTFAPQIGLAHARTLGRLGVDGASSVVNASDFVTYESLAALHLVFAGASVGSGPRSVAGQRAEWYRERAEAEWRRLVAEVDEDGDGEPDRVRRLGVGRMVRE
ncbi:MAG: hypothetical protein AAGI53_04080 [Planctomycetota bacterium]